jgi:hypothetical protein
LYFELDRNKKYITKKELSGMKTNISFTSPNNNTFTISNIPKLAVVIG